MTILIFALTLILLVYGIRGFLHRAPQRGKRFLLQLLLVVVALLALWLAMTGRLHWLVALFSSLLPFGRRLLPLLFPLFRWWRGRNPSQPQSTPGQQSAIETAWLTMTLDHDSGEISGVIRNGPFSGSQLQQLSDQQLIDLYQLCISKDPQALKLLDSYIDRHRPHMASNNGSSEQQHEQHNDGTAQSSTDLSKEEAYQVLGLEPGASESEIIKAHKRMMQKVHPDRGGSNYLAAKINQAKQRLLG
ncbi:MAG: DnaJ domain-containing protein [Motiliproteus sp.]